MSSYPSAVYSPRTKENKAGVIYAPEETTKLFAEDIVKLDDEVVAIETELGESPKAGYADVASRLSGIEGSIPADFTDLADVPSAFTDQGGKIVAVNEGETALEFIDPPTGGGGFSYFSVIDYSIELYKTYVYYTYLLGNLYSNDLGYYQYPMPAITIKELIFFIKYTDGFDEPIEITIFKNGVTTGLTETIDIGGAQVVKITGDISISEGDYIEIKIDNTASSQMCEIGYHLYTKYQI